MYLKMAFEVQIRLIWAPMVRVTCALTTMLSSTFLFARMPSGEFTPAHALIITWDMCLLS